MRTDDERELHLPDLGRDDHQPASDELHLHHLREQSQHLPHTSGLHGEFIRILASANLTNDQLPNQF